MDKPNDILLKSSINTALQKFESYWGYREDKQSEIVESVFKELKENNKLISQNVSQQRELLPDFLYKIGDEIHYKFRGGEDISELWDEYLKKIG